VSLPLNKLVNQWIRLFVDWAKFSPCQFTVPNSTQYKNRMYILFSIIFSWCILFLNYLAQMTQRFWETWQK